MARKERPAHDETAQEMVDRIEGNTQHDSATADQGAAAETNGIATGRVVETKEAKFRRLREARMPRAIKAILSIANLGSRQSYTYTAEEAVEVLEKLRKAVDRVEATFTAAPVAATNDWRLMV
jgi:hypothetical protein